MTSRASPRDQAVACTGSILRSCHTSWVRFGLLGPLVATSDEGASVDLGQPRQRAVLALLVLDVNTGRVG